MKILSVLLGLAAVVPQAAQAAETQTLVRQALSDGRASGPIEGPVAEEARKRLNATGVLTLWVKRLYQFEQADCGRLQLDFTQDAALLPGATLPASYSWSTRMNMCADGRAPTSLRRRHE